MKYIFTVLIILLVQLSAAKYGVVVTSHKSKVEIPTLRQLKDIFLMKRHYVGDTKVLPINMLLASDLRQKFEKNVLKINREKLNKYWIKQHFQGISPPITQASARSVKLFIKNVEGAIGYLPLSLVDDDMRILYEF